MEHQTFRFLLLCVTLAVLTQSCGYTSHWYQVEPFPARIAGGTASFFVWWGDFDAPLRKYQGNRPALDYSDPGDSILVFDIVYYPEDSSEVYLKCFDIVDVTWSTETKLLATQIGKLWDTVYTCADCWDYKGPRRRLSFGPIRLPDKKPERIYVSLDLVLYDETGQKEVERKRMVVPIEYHRKSFLKDFLDGR